MLRKWLNKAKLFCHLKELLAYFLLLTSTLACSVSANEYDLRHGVRPGGRPVCRSSEVRKWNVTATGNLMMTEMHVIGIYFCFGL